MTIPNAKNMLSMIQWKSKVSGSVGTFGFGGSDNVIVQVAVAETDPTDPVILKTYNPGGYFSLSVD